jgi:hypothetical protein
LHPLIQIPNAFPGHYNVVNNSKRPISDFFSLLFLLFFFQLVSELIVLAIRPEDDGVFFCAAQNPAGVARGNFTVRVVDSLENNSDGPETSSGGLQENTDSYNSQEQESTLAESDDMFQVNVLIFFGL